ncbi:MAG: flagellar biosynthetic protein FliO [Mariniblastus sp.]|nr:flagellar biosynthetic protein FliO [Mariniblastus sp.]
MNQKFKINLVALLGSKSSQCGWFVLATNLIFLANSVFAQNQFQGTADFPPPHSVQWTAPNSNPPNLPPQASHTSPPANNSNVTFPESLTPYGGGVRPAGFESPIVEPKSIGSFESKIDGAAETLSKWKDLAGEKTTGFFNSLQQDGNWLKEAQTTVGSSEISKMLGSLALVLGLYFAFVWIMRKLNPNGSTGLPLEVIEVLGQVPFGNRKNLQLVRLGSKLLLLMNSAEGTQPIGEITDPAEVDYLASLCPGHRPRRTNQLNRSPRPARIQSAAETPTSDSSAHRAIGPTNLNDVIQILQNANHRQGAVFEA